MRELNADVIVLGGGTGGFAAALAAARMGRTVILTEETDWIGGQLTSQAVPPDEHPWIEEFGCTLSYRRFRQGARRYFRDHFPLRGETLLAPRFRPGGALVSCVPSPPEVALEVLQQLILLYRMYGRVVLMLESRPVAAETDGDRVSSVTVEKRHSGKRFVLPVRMENLLAAAKNIGTTHITNGCHRLHPVEWNVGEAAGTLAAYCFDKGLAPTQVRNDPSRMSDFQRVLEEGGFDLDWPELRAL